MEKSNSFTLTLSGLALTATLFLGCQDFLGQKTEMGSNASVDQTPQEVALKLAIKDSGACMELKSHVLAAHEQGIMPRGIDSEFVSRCVREVHDTDKKNHDGKIPPILIPDDKTRCHWILSQMDRGHEEMMLKYRYYCPDDCGKLELTDSVSHERFCRDPKPDCAELIRKLSLLEPKTEVFDRLHHLIGDVCTDKLIGPNPNPNPNPKPIEHTLCDSLKIILTHSQPGAAEHQSQEAQFKTHCGEIPHDSLPPRPPHHDSIRVEPPHHDSIPVKPPMPVPPRVNCDSLRIHLHAMDSTSVGFAELRHKLLESCPVRPIPLPVPLDSMHK